MKILILMLFFISIVLSAKTRGDLKSDLSSFTSSKTSSSSSSSDDDDDNDNDDADQDENSYSSHSSSNNNANVPSPFKVVWYWQNIFIQENKSIQKENKLAYFGTSYTYQNWTPTGINNATTETTELNIAKLELSLFYNSIYFSYETSFYGANLENQRELLEIRNQEKHGWERFLTEVVLPLTLMLGKQPFAKIYFGYDEQVFISTITSLEDKYYIPRSESGKSDSEDVKHLEISEGDKIVTTTLFKDYYLGLKMDFHPIIKSNMGFFLLTYNKPYSLTIDGDQLSEQIHDTDFFAVGLYGDLSIDYNMVFLKAGFKIGSGDIHFVGLDTHLDDLVDDDLNIMYFQLNMDFGLHYDITDLIRVETLVSTEYRNFYLSRSDSDEDDDIDDSATFNLNDDFIFTFYAGISVSF